MSPSAQQLRTWSRRAGPAALIAIAFLLAVVVVNPLREMSYLDDSWSYARMVHDLLATGRYRLDSWAAANMPVQIYLAAGLSRIFGYSLTLLRCTTLLLFALGLGSFYLLLRELDYDRENAALLTLAIPATPLVLMLAFTFMTDVQFFGWLMAALLLYHRGLRRGSAWSLFFASLAAGCAIGTRQFGLAIVVGLVAAWLLPSRHRPPVSLLFIATIVPLLVGVAQIHSGLAHPNFTQTLRLAETRQFFHLSALALLKETLWRCAVLAQYAGMSVAFLLPLFLARTGSLWRGRLGRVPIWLLALLGAALLLIGLSMPSPITARPDARRHGLTEPLAMYWLLPSNLYPIRAVMWALDLAGILGAVLLITACLQRLRRGRPAPQRRPETIFLAATGLALLALHLAYRQLNDTYVTSLIPFALLLLGRRLPAQPAKTLARASVALAMSSVLLTSLWMRGEYAAQEALWSTAETLLHRGVPPLDIPARAWNEYYGSFDDWIAAGAPGYDIHHRERYLDPLHDPYHLWLKQRLDSSPYRIDTTSTLSAPPGWRVLAWRGFRAANFSRRYVIARVKTAASSQSPPAPRPRP